MHSKCRLLPDHIVRGRANTCDPALKLLNEEVTSDIHTHKQILYKDHLDAHWDYRHNTHITVNTPTQHGYRTRTLYIDGTTHIKQHRSKEVQPNGSPARTITVALDKSNAFDTINIRTLIRELLQTKIPGTIIRFIANYIKKRKAYTTYRNHTSSQRQFKTGVPQDDVLSPTIFNI